MVAPQEEEVFREFNFVAKQEAYAFYGLFSTINVVAQEQVIGVGRVAPILENFQ